METKRAVDKQMSSKMSQFLGKDITREVKENLYVHSSEGFKLKAQTDISIEM